MPELQVDVAVANRFISSLSKSLQALCHGCMDFDSGIEIVGYINVNIDCGSKVDYVLNEKVLKSTTNSMTFVSNSFLAKKEQPKNTQDGSCSPIQELIAQSQFTSPYQQRMRGSFHGAHPKSTMPMSQSFAFRGGQKRSWTGMERDWRVSPKKHRGGRHQYGSSSETSSIPQSALYPPSNQNIDSSFKIPKTSTLSSHTETVGDDSQSEINIKKEILDSDSQQKTSHESEQASDQTADNKSEQERTANVNIKSDPDAETPGSHDGEMFSSDSAANIPDIKDPFLQLSNPEESQQTDEKLTEESDSQLTSSEKPGTAPDDFPENSASDVVDDQNSNNLTDTAYEDSGENITTGSDMPGEYDETGEDAVYPHSVYSDAGEGSSDAGQFEVIEIDDEDEDVQAMFSDSRKNPTRCSYLKTKGVSLASEGFDTINTQKGRMQSEHPIPMTVSPIPGSSHVHTPDDSQRHTSTSQDNQCPFCHDILPTRSLLQRHMSVNHGQDMPYTCSQCGRGFATQSGLKRHVEDHGNKRFECEFCDVQFKRKQYLMCHLKGVHKVFPCLNCLASFDEKGDLNEHIASCIKWHCFTDTGK